MKGVERFLAHWTGLVWTVARTMSRTYQLTDEDVEDITQAVLLKLSRLTAEQRTFGDPFIKTCINNSARDQLHLILKAGRNLYSLDEMCDDSETTTFADTMPDNHDYEQASQDRLMVERFLHGLEEPSREVVSLKYGLRGKALPNSAISARLGISTLKVAAILKQAIETMRTLAEPTTLEAYETTCLICSQTELILLPLNARLPNQCHCMNCGEIQPCTSAPACEVGMERWVGVMA